MQFDYKRSQNSIYSIMQHELVPCMTSQLWKNNVCADTTDVHTSGTDLSLAATFKLH